MTCLLVRIYPLTPFFPQLPLQGPPKACPAYEPLPPASFQLQFMLMELVLEQEPIHEEHPGLFHVLDSVASQR